MEGFDDEKATKTSVLEQWKYIIHSWREFLLNLTWEDHLHPAPRQISEILEKYFEPGGTNRRLPQPMCYIHLHSTARLNIRAAAMSSASNCWSCSVCIGAGCAGNSGIWVAVFLWHNYLLPRCSMHEPGSPIQKDFSGRSGTERHEATSASHVGICTSRWAECRSFASGRGGSSCA